MLSVVMFSHIVIVKLAPTDVVAVSKLNVDGSTQMAFAACGSVGPANTGRTASAIDATSISAKTLFFKLISILPSPFSNLIVCKIRI
jgi:hypothetical protein